MTTTVAAPEGVALLNPGPIPDATVDPTAQTMKLTPVRPSGVTHELFGWYVVHADDELVLQEIADAMGAFLTRQAAGRAHVRKKNAGFDPIRTITEAGS